MIARILIRRTQSNRFAPSETPSGQGNFDTAARLDTGAARIRNTTSPAGSLCHNWDGDRTNAPSQYPEVSDKPE
jgi:hypothetical protein